MQVRVQEKGPLVRAIATLPDGRRFTAVVRAEPTALAGELDLLEGDEPELGGRFLKKLKKGLKKAVVGPLKLAHKVTHHPKSPIAKAEKAMQKFVAKNLPIAKPFINIHNSLAKPVHKALAGKKVKQAVTAKAIAEVTKNLPIKQKGFVQSALITKVKQDEVLKGVAKKIAKTKVVTAAAKALKANPKNKPAKKLLTRLKAAKSAKPYRVTFPNGKTVSVPANRVH
jgi:hypothetical protein